MGEMLQEADQIFHFVKNVLQSWLLLSGTLFLIYMQRCDFLWFFNTCKAMSCYSDRQIGIDLTV